MRTAQEIEKQLEHLKARMKRLRVERRLAFLREQERALFARKGARHAD